MRLKIEIDEETFALLAERAGKERRSAPSQAEFMLIRALRKREPHQTRSCHQSHEQDHAV